MDNRLRIRPEALRILQGMLYSEARQFVTRSPRCRIAIDLERHGLVELVHVSAEHSMYRITEAGRALLLEQDGTELRDELRDELEVEHG